MPGVGNDFSYTRGEDGRCLAKVNDAMDRAGIGVARKPWAIHSVAALRASKDYVEAEGPISEADLDKFPKGTVYVAERGGAGQTKPGHIAVKVEENGNYKWCSDFRHGAVVYGSGYDKIWVFIPKGDATTLAVKGARSEGAIAATPQLSPAQRLDAARTEGAPLKLGDSGPEVELLKNRLTWLRSQSPALQEVIPPVTKGNQLDSSTVNAFGKLREAVGIQGNGREVGANELNAMNAVIKLYHTNPDSFPVDRSIEATVKESNLYRELRAAKGLSR